MTDALNVHRQKPARSNVANRPRYQLYRDDLQQDFAKACGYCGDEDERTDRSTFHIDHFAPKKPFQELELVYSNLVYACRFCNVSKSNHWIGDDPKVPNDGSKGFVDPCTDEYDVHLERDISGRIVAKTPLGSYIVKRLHLDLIRHELLWRARRIRALRDEIDVLMKEYKARGKSPPEYADLLNQFYELTILIDDYELRSFAR